MSAPQAEAFRSYWEQRQFLSAADVRSQLGLAALPLHDIVDAERRAGRLIAAWDGEQYCYPAFQFDPFGYLRKGIAELLAVLPMEKDRGVSSEALLWLLQPSRTLNGATPASIFVASAEVGVGLARMRFQRP
jgi:hypothetical protein